ncbi:TRAFAC clade GTPase domain-containing protein [Streptomyces albipurpureus]|uniref:Double-GTPase 2 domain-containing protein n=1 Tax=Streptomyces albipurpureus TaxID=2897419 RepID=A0ABT0UF97_9ACTN|nr:hypothetical protein [Streptomyces sp. CWNU-1]MCM2386896.1 hypothetical protein [Streptomyces sp. CWNU-1]
MNPWSINPWLSYPLTIWAVYTLAVSLCVALYALPTAVIRTIGAQGKRIGPLTSGAHDPRIVPIASGEPAQHSYWTRQLRADAKSWVKAATTVLHTLLITRWLGTTARNLLRGRRPSTPLGHRSGRPEGAITSVALTLTGPGYGAGVMVGTTVAAAFLCLVTVVFGLLIGMVCAALATASLILRGLDLLAQWGRRIHLKCPYPGCYQPIALPVYHCPRCSAVHQRLRAGRFGVFRRVCQCGERLRTSALLGRHTIPAYCPHCDLPLPRAFGTTRIVHIPIVGGTSSGKTMLMAAMFAGLRSWSDRGQLSVTYATEDDRREVNRIKGQLDRDGWVHQTAVQQPRAMMLQITRGRSRRLLYLYDPMGETFGDSVIVREQQYLAHADGVVLVADALAEPEVRRRLNGRDAPRAVDARPSPEGPKDTYDRLAGEFTALSGRRARTPVATVVTKRDVLDQLTSLPVPGARIDDWLTAIGLGDLVQSLEHDFGRTRYWAVSAHAATGAGALDGESRRAAEPVLWLLSRTGLPVNPLLTSEAGKR